MSVIIRETLGNPKPSCIRRASEIPWSKFNRTKSFYIPNVKKLMRDSIQRLAIHARFAKRAGLNDLRGSQMLHAISRVIVGRKMKQEGVRVKLGRTPHRSFRAHDLFNVTDQGRAF